MPLETALNRPNIFRQEAPVKEVLVPGQFVALHSRLLLAGNHPVVLNPDYKTIPVITAEDLTVRNYQAFENRSHEQRRAYWQGKGDYQEQMETWILDTVSKFNAGKKFFTGKKGQQWAELFKNIGINDATNFTAQDAINLYNNYLNGELQEQRSAQFVKDITAKTFNSEDSNHLKAVEWIGHIFGVKVNQAGLNETGAHEAIKHYALAQKKFQINPEAFVKAANTEIPTAENQPPQLRINQINPEEARILRFLWGGVQAIIRPGEGPNPPDRTGPPEEGLSSQPLNPEEPFIPSPPVTKEEEYEWRYERPGNPRRFPNEQMINQILDSGFIAQGLKQKHPDQYAGVSTAQLAQIIASEQIQLGEGLRRIGLDNQKLSVVATTAIRKYEQFLDKEYGIKTPEIETVHIQPISEKIADYWGVRDSTLAFVNVGYPVIFLNMQAIPNVAARIGENLGINWEQYPPQVLGRLIERVLSEVHPHEYSHLTGDLAFWKIVKKDTNEVVHFHPGRMGIMVSKPVEHTEGTKVEIKYKERGRGLMEAVTTELTNRWARSMNQRMEVEAYPQERKVLLELESLLAREQGISRDEAFKKFVRAYFSQPEMGVNKQGQEEPFYPHFINLVRSLSRSTTDGKHYHRPYFLSIIYGLMGYEAGTGNYDLTLSYIKNQLSEDQESQILDNIKHLQLSKSAEEYLRQALSLIPQQNAA